MRKVAGVGVIDGGDARRFRNRVLERGVGQLRNIVALRGAAWLRDGDNSLVLVEHPRTRGRLRGTLRAFGGTFVVLVYVELRLNSFKSTIILTCKVQKMSV